MSDDRLEAHIAIDRRTFVYGLGAGILTAPLAAEAQQAGKVYRIGFLGGSSASSFVPLLESLRQGLREFDYVEGRNITFEYRYADGFYDRLPQLAMELVRLRVDVIVTEGTPQTLAAKRATATIPIVMAHIGDAVSTGVVASMARPGGNVTGTSFLLPELSGKRLALLKECVPRLTRVAVLSNRANPIHVVSREPMTVVARSLSIGLEQADVRGAEELATTFARIRSRAQAVLVQDDAMFRDHEKQIAALALNNRWPSVFGFRTQVAVGGLMNYAPDRLEMYRHAAFYIDRILKGTKPADLPVEQPTKFELIINLKTAKALGLTIPPSLLARADQVIE